MGNSEVHKWQKIASKTKKCRSENVCKRTSNVWTIMTLKQRNSMRRVKLYYLCVFVVLVARYNVVSAKNLVVASYNLWNVMFQWDARKHYIAEMIRQANPDIIGFQEIRADANGKRSQLKDLQELIPEYKYSSFYSTTTVENRFGKNAISGWENEGLGILSKYSIVMSHQIPLSKAENNDHSPRALLHTQIEYELHEIFFIVVHFSTNKKLQCQNAMRLINFVASTGADRTVIVGDFNAYADYDWPVQAVQNGFFLPHGCPVPVGFEPMGEDQGYGFDDAWSMTSQNKKGYTFSNMPTPGLINRPDRILVSRVGLDPVKTLLLGDGNKYAETYSTWSYVSRIKTIINMAKEQWNGHEISYTCYLDCGPHGSCRCGVCVGGGDKLNCDLSSCTECTASHYNIILMLYYSLSVYIFSIIYISVGLWAKYTHRRTLKKIFLCRRWFGCKHFVAFIVAGLAIFYTVIKVGLSGMIASALSRIPEEMFPSDHLMVVSEIKMTYH